MAAAKKEQVVYGTAVKLYSAFLTDVFDRCVQYPTPHLVGLPYRLLARDPDSRKHKQMGTFWCLLVFFTQPWESEARQTSENRNQKKEALPQFLSCSAEPQAALP